MAKESKTEFGGTLSRIVNAAALRREKTAQELLAGESVKAIAWTEGICAVECLNAAIASGGEYPEWFVAMIEENAADIASKRQAATPVAGVAQ